MILDKILLPLAEKRNAGNEEYLERHKRIINTLPYREVLGLYIPEMKKVAKELSRKKTNAKAILEIRGYRKGHQSSEPPPLLQQQSLHARMPHESS